MDISSFQAFQNSFHKNAPISNHLFRVSWGISMRKYRFQQNDVGATFSNVISPHILRQPYLLLEID